MAIQWVCTRVGWGLAVLGAAFMVSAQTPASSASMAAPTTSPTTTPALPVVTPATVVAHYGALVHANYEDTLASARRMQQAIAAFTAKPSADTLNAARSAWRAAREFYGQTEAFRFYAGPIDDDEGPEGRINAWPMDEAYVDYVDGQPNAGIINDRKQALSKKALMELNERGGEENIATGWHAIEFLLWGQDLSDTGAGDRSHEDFVNGKRPNADRRRQYLTVVTDLLIDDLKFLVRAWAPNVKDNYRARFQADEKEALRKMLVGLGSLSRGELAGERLEVALASQDQEDEHSCFSDNTHRDVVNNALGIENVWLGRYRRGHIVGQTAKAAKSAANVSNTVPSPHNGGTVLQGPSLRDLVATKNAGLAEKTTRQIRTSVEAAINIQAPFDREIIGDSKAPGRQRIQAVIDSLTQQSKDLVEAASAIGITHLTLVKPTN